MAGDVYPVPFANSQISGGGSFRLSFVSLDTALWAGPRNAAQSLVMASFDSGFGLRGAAPCPRAVEFVLLSASAAPASTRSAERREIENITGRLAHLVSGKRAASRR